MKKVFLAFAIVAASFAANAQTASKTSFGGGVRVGLPVGTFGDFSSFGIGAELQAEHAFSSQITGTLTTGYNHFIGKEIGGFDFGSTGYIPVLAGIRVYPSSTFFVGGKAGMSFFTNEGGGSSFTYEPQIGYNGQKFQLALGYQSQVEDGGSLGHVGLSAIFKFN